MISFDFILQSILLGVGLAMDAFSVSLANGLNEPKMPGLRANIISGTFGFFQFAMPMLGWVCVHTIVTYFSALEKFIPWIALVLLCYIGGKMLLEGFKNKGQENDIVPKLGFGTLMVQAIATSIDALSVGFTIAEYNWWMACVCAFITGVVTHIISLVGIALGKKLGTKLSGKANILGGVILIAIGIKICFF